MREFRDFLRSSRLADVPCSGNKFTWFSGDGRSMIRIDIFLLT